MEVYKILWQTQQHSLIPSLQDAQSCSRICPPARAVWGEKCSWMPDAECPALTVWCLPVPMAGWSSAARMLYSEPSCVPSLWRLLRFSETVCHPSPSSFAACCCWQQLEVFWSLLSDCHRCKTRLLSLLENVCPCEWLTAPGDLQDHSPNPWTSRLHLLPSFSGIWYSVSSL